MQVQKVDLQSLNAARDFANSFKYTGFAVITNHPISSEFLSEFYQEWLEYFSSDRKFDDLYERETLQGYFKGEIAKDAKVYDIKEFYNIYPGGRYPVNMSSRALELHKILSTVASTIAGWLQQELPADIVKQLSMPLPDMLEGTDVNLLRINYYPPLKGDEHPDAMRAYEHADVDLITLLCAANTNGLQIQDKAGNWHDVVADPNSIVVNAGDMLQLCTQGYYRSTMHRVRNPQGELENKSRISAPLFVTPRNEIQLSPEHTSQSYRLERQEINGLY